MPDYEQPASTLLQDQQAAARIGGAEWPQIHQGFHEAFDALSPEGQHEAVAKLGLAPPQRLTGTLRHTAFADHEQPFSFVDPAGQLTPDARFGYANALVKGHATSPAGYAQHVQGATGHDGSAFEQQAPTNEETTDAAIGVLNHKEIPPTPAGVAVVKQQLLDRWAQTGERPSRTQLLNSTNPDISITLAQPNETGWGAAPVETDPAKLYVLHHIAHGEAQAYNELYGGGRFEGYVSFPQWEGREGPAGISHAAGLYQFQPDTWEAERKALGLTDFSPASQDAAAWHLAETTYAKKTGRDLHADAEQHNVDWKALASQWTSFGSPMPTTETEATAGGVGLEPALSPEAGQMIGAYLKSAWDTFVEHFDKTEPSGLEQWKQLQKASGGSLGLLEALEQGRLGEWVQQLGKEGQDFIESPAMSVALAFAGADITAFHGTAALFGSEPGAPYGKFRLDFIGTGEGTSAPGGKGFGAYGHGVYMAENRGIADWYKRSDAHRKGIPGGNLYTAEITAAMDHLAMWNEPVSAQSDKVLAAIRSAWKEITGSSFGDKINKYWNLPYSDLYNRLSRADINPEGAPKVSELLAKGGLPGHAFPDAYSRGTTGAPTHNFVMYDPSYIRITHRNGIEVPAGLLPRLASLLRGGGNLEAGLARVNAELNQIFKPLEYFGKFWYSGDEQQAYVRRLSQESKESGRETIRRQRGLAEQAVAKVASSLEKFRKQAESYMPEYKRWLSQLHLGQVYDPNVLPDLAAFTDHVEGRRPLPAAHPLLPLADALKQWSQFMRSQIEAHLPDMSSFIEDYYRHLWTEPNKAERILRGSGRTGSGASLKARVIPSLNEGIAKGLTPRILNPVENMIHYAEGMRNFLANKAVMKEAELNGYLVWSNKGPPADGWEALGGAQAEHGAGGVIMRAYAPPGFARAYNSWVGQGFYSWPRVGDLYSKTQFAANLLTGFKLSLSGYHAINIAQETLIGSLSHAIGEISRGQLVSGLKDMGMTLLVPPIKIGAQLVKGRRFQNAYLSDSNDPLIQLFASAGGRAVGRGAAYMVGQRANFVRAIKRGSLVRELAEEIKGVAGKEGESVTKRAVLSPVRFAALAANELGRVADTLMGPLFDHVIPYVKMANWRDEMASWLRANPLAGESQKLAQARKILDSVDDRFGEMNQDNLFWPRAVKQFLNTYTVSVGWEYGTLRAFGGGTADILRGDVLSPRARWLLAFPVTVGFVNSIYQYLKTGKPFWDSPTPTLDMIAPRTGGVTPQGAPERALLPGYEKDVLNDSWQMMQTHNVLDAIHNAASWAGSKANPLMQLGGSLVSGLDWHGNPIQHQIPDIGSYEIPSAMGNLTREIWNQIKPISIEQQGQRLIGSKLEGPERFMGLRPAPGWVENPEYTKGRIAAHEKRMMQEEKWLRKRQQRTLVNPNEAE